MSCGVIGQEYSQHVDTYVDYDHAVKSQAYYRTLYRELPGLMPEAVCIYIYMGRERGIHGLWGKTWHAGGREWPRPWQYVCKLTGIPST